MKENKWEIIGKLKSSSWRVRVLRALKNAKTPKELAKETNISSSHISEVLREFQEMKLIKCLNPGLRKGKLYVITENGKKMLNKFVENT